MVAIRNYKYLISPYPILHVIDEMIKIWFTLKRCLQNDDIWGISRLLFVTILHEQEIHWAKLQERKLVSSRFVVSLIICYQMSNFTYFFSISSISFSQKGVPAYTAPQPEEAMKVLVDKASQLSVRTCFTIMVNQDTNAITGVINL